MRLIQKVSFALPKTFICAPDDAGVMYIKDQNGETIAHIHIREGTFTIYDEYEYCEQVIDALESQGEKVRDMIAERNQREQKWKEQKSKEYEKFEAINILYK